MRVGVFRAAVAAMIAALLLAGCSQDIRDVKLSEMNQPHNTKKLLEDLTQGERETIAYYVAERSVRGDIDYTITIGDVLELAAKEKAEAEERRIKAEAEAAEQRAKAEAEQEAFLKARAEAGKKRLAELMAMPASELELLPRQQRTETLVEFGSLLQRAADADGSGQNVGNQNVLLTQYLGSGAASESKTLGEILDEVQQEPHAVRARMREVAEAAAKQDRAERFLRLTNVRNFVWIPSTRSAAAELIPAEDFELLDAFVNSVKGQLDVAAQQRMTLAEALRQAREREL